MAAMDARISLFVICVKAVIYLLQYSLHDCTFKTNWIGSTKWTMDYIYKEWTIATDYFIFLKILICVEEPLWILDLIMYQLLKYTISASVLFEGVFYIWVSLTDRLLTFYENKDDSLN